jgi:hypothetical protein
MPANTGSTISAVVDRGLTDLSVVSLVAVHTRPDFGRGSGNPPGAEEGNSGADKAAGVNSEVRQGGGGAHPSPNGARKGRPDR